MSGCRLWQTFSVQKKGAIFWKASHVPQNKTCSHCLYYIMQAVRCSRALQLVFSLRRSVFTVPVTVYRRELPVPTARHVNCYEQWMESWHRAALFMRLPFWHVFIFSTLFVSHTHKHNTVLACWFIALCKTIEQGGILKTWGLYSHVGVCKWTTTF